VARSKLASASPIHPTGSESPHVRLSGEQRREQLVQVAVDLFARKGFNGTTTREIAAAAGVTEAIIFRHFETKEHLYTAIIDQKPNSTDAAGWIAKLRLAMNRDDDQAVIRQLIDGIISMHKTDPKFERLMLYAALEGNEIALLYMRQVTAAIVDEFRNYFARRQKQGAFRPIPPDAVLSAIAGMAKCHALNKYVHGLKEQCISDDQAVEAFTQIAIDGLCGPNKAKRSATARKR
jgi:TetR/AcrR family transcriptional regulator